MSSMSPVRRNVVNVIGTLGYISVFLQWMWSFLIVLYPMITSNTFKQTIFYQQHPIKVDTHSDMYSDFMPFFVILSIAVTLVVVIFTVIALIGLPKKVGKTGAAITHGAANIVIKNTSPPAKAKSNRWKISLSFRLIAAIKFLLTVIPLIILLFAPYIATLPSYIINAIGNVCFAFSVFYWIVEYTLAKLLRVPKKHIW